MILANWGDTESLTQPADWSFPVPIAFGPGRFSEIGEQCRRLGMSRPLVVTDRGSVELPFVDAALGAISAAGGRGGVFADVSPNPTDRDALAGRAAFVGGGHDGVVAIGGGSGMDAGKLVSLIANDRADLWAFDFDAPSAPDLVGGDFVPLICVPTTAGTGAETESTAMVTDTEAGVKRCVWHPTHRPALAVLDPELTLGLPPHLTAWTGVDALVHAVEAFTVPGWHPLCDGLALEAMRLIGVSLPVAYERGDDLAARSAMLVGSCLAGVAFLKGLGLVHAISHMVGAVHDTHHGLTNAVLFPAVLEHNRPGIEAKASAMTTALGAKGHDFSALVDWVNTVLDQLQIPASLAEIGVPDSNLGEIAAKAMTDAAASTNAVAVSVDEVERLLRRAHRAAR